MQLRRVIPIALLLLTAAAVAGVAQPQLGRSADAPATTRTIVVDGTGSVTTVPDRASFTFSVSNRAKTASDALAQNGTAARAVIAALKAAGVAAADIQTTQVSLDPQTNQDGTLIVGYAASSSVSVQSTVAKAGDLVDAAVGAGANGVSGPSLVVSDQSALYRTALAKAVADATAKAQALATAAGLTLGPVQNVTESGGSTPIPLDMKSAAGSAAPIEPGSQEIQASVTVTYDAS